MIQKSMCSWVHGVQVQTHLQQDYTLKQQFITSAVTLLKSLEGLLTAIDSPEAIDGEFRSKKFREWQEYMQEVSA